jgi:hypothetical protein
MEKLGLYNNTLSNMKLNKSVGLRCRLNQPIKNGQGIVLIKPNIPNS